MKNTDESDHEEDRKMPAKAKLANPPEEKMDPGDGSAQPVADAAASSRQGFLSQVARAPRGDPVAATKAGAGSKRRMGDPKRSLPSSSKKGKRSPSPKRPQQQPGFGSPSGSLTLSSGKHSVNYVVKSSFNPEVIRRAAGTEKFGTARDTESPVNETAEERRLRKNRINERRKRARRAMKIDYLNEQFHNLIADNSRMKDENEELKKHIAAVRSGEIPASLFQPQGSAEETSTGSGDSPAEQQQDQVSAALTEQVESNPNVASASQNAGGALVSSATAQQDQGISPEILERLVATLVTGSNQEGLQGELAGVTPEILQRLLTNVVAGSNQEGLHGQALAGDPTGMQGRTQVGEAQLPSGSPYRFRSIDASNPSSHSESRQRSNTDEHNLLAMRLLSREFSTSAPPPDSITSTGIDTTAATAGSGRGVGITDATNRSDILQQARSLSDLSPETRRNLDALLANLGPAANPPTETSHQPPRPNFQVSQGGPSASFNDALVALLRSQQQPQQPPRPQQERSLSQSAASAASDAAMPNQNLQSLLSQQQHPSESESILVSFLRQSLQSDRQREETQHFHEILREQQRQQQEEILVRRRRQEQEQQQQLLQHLQQLQGEEHRQREEQRRQREILQRLQEEQRQKEELQRQHEALLQLQEEQRQREDLQRQQVVLQFEEEQRQRERQQQQGIHMQMQEGQRAGERQLLEELLRRLQGQDEERQRDHQEGQRQRQQEMLLVQQLRLMHESQQEQQQPRHDQPRQQQGGNPPHGPLLRLHRQQIAGANNAPEPPPAPSASLASNIDLGRFLMGQRDYQLQLAHDGSRSNNINNPAAPNDAPDRGRRPQPPYEDSKRRDDCDEDDYPGIDRNILYSNRKKGS